MLLITQQRIDGLIDIISEELRLTAAQAAELRGSFTSFSDLRPRLANSLFSAAQRAVVYECLEAAAAVQERVKAQAERAEWEAERSALAEKRHVEHVYTSVSEMSNSLEAGLRTVADNPELFSDEERAVFAAAKVLQLKLADIDKAHGGPHDYCCSCECH